MPTPSSHPNEELQDLLDERLDPAARVTVEQHLQNCAQCQRELAALRWTKAFAARHFAATEAPADLQADIGRALRAETPLHPPGVIEAGFQQKKRWPVFAMAAAIALAAIVAGSYFFARPRLPEAVAENYQAYEAQSLALERETRDVRQMENYFAEHGLGFKTRVFDLAMMEYHLVGGRVERLGGRSSALFVYRGPGDHPLLCQMYPGRVEDLPAGAIRREHDGIAFYRYEIKGLTVVFWPEKEIMCALVSEIAPEKVVALAFAKAEASL